MCTFMYSSIKMFILYPMTHCFVRREFYGFDDTFDVSHLMVRCREGKKRNVYFVSSLIKTIIECNTERIRVGWGYALHISISHHYIYIL